MLAALAGPMTAIVALELQSVAAADERTPSKLSRLVRKMIVSWRWRRTRDVRIEVPSEKIVKEILYVPILTDDPEAVRRATSETLEKDVADLVTISIARAGNGSPPQHKAS